ALWHIYHHLDTSKIRNYLIDQRAQKLGISTVESRKQYDDPIHLSKTFLDPKNCSELFLNCQVQGWEIRQEPGQAIMIPAYSPHQVCNLANCIKIAMDFLSPQSIERCIQVKEELREQRNHRGNVFLTL
ncbi:uncharacterized protein MELLADRAFT_40785, partial [Melampsora larici-populina 98AG31]